MEEIFKGERDEVEKLLDVIRLTQQEQGGGEMERALLEKRVLRFLNERQVSHLLAELEDSGYINYDDVSVTCLA